MSIQNKTNINNDNCIIQWNCDGLYSHYEQFKRLITENNPYIVCLQETKFKCDHIPKIKNYKSYTKNLLSNTVAHGGVAIFVNENFHSEEVILNTNLQAVAITIFYPIKFTICNLYLAGSERLSLTNLSNIVDQLKHPFMIMGDFNSHNPL